MHLAGSASPEHCLLFKNTSIPNAQILVGCEAKGNEASVCMCYPQLIAVCGSSAIEMHRLGLAQEDCVVPGIVMAGSCCQFCAIYLLNNNFPNFVVLSPEISLFGTFQDQYAIAQWYTHTH
jgi:hypothetical protein